jgi:hypothetical protein
VIDAGSQAVLHEIVRRESRSLLSYIGDSYPWTTSEGVPGVAVLAKLIRQERASVTALGQYLVRHKAPPPFIGSYPAQFTSWNFIALEYLVPRLQEAQKRAITELQADLSKITDVPSRQQCERLLGVKRMTLAGLEGLAVSPAPAGA